MNRRVLKNSYIIIALIMTMLLFLTACSSEQVTSQPSDSASNAQTEQAASDQVTKDNTSNQQSNNSDTPDTNQTADASQPSGSTQIGNLEVHFIDVGQADAILIKGPNNQNIMIDAGNNEDGNQVVNYIKNQGVSDFKAVIGTHPHEDHIGGLDTVIKSFNIEKIYMPKISHTTKTFEDVLDAVDSKGLKISVAKKGASIPIDGMTAVFLGPVGSRYDELNDYSAVLKLTFGNNSFLFQGDAEAKSEREILNSDMAGNLNADVLKVGHHGSHSSTTSEYLAKVNPKYAVIMLGQGNDYGHPHKEPMALLKERGITVFRTDQNGTIVATSDRNNISFNTKPGDYTANSTGGSAKPSESTNKQSSNTPAATPAPKPVEQKPAANGEPNYVDGNGNGLIKGNVNSKGEKIYHMPGGAYYDKTDAEYYFKTESEAQAAGFRRSKR